MERFREGQYIMYINRDRVELGKIKSLREHGAFVYYHSGETTALTNYEDMYPIKNDYIIKKTTLGEGAYE